ncbi:peptidoglycan DD-metalloendopeptidase family protein [Nocardioides sp. GCM10027113]|uniref:peptidoglycan DD-metalloendopeptidase family protein n=1 Tax=unclassified Nocardioides TaxID=2615069 RepID=UPI00360CF3F6
MRPFPRAARRRLAASLVACAVAVGAMTVPFAHADPLKDRQRKVQGQIRQADKDLHASSAALRKADARLATAQAALTTARGELQSARTRLAAARVRDQEMQARLEQAEDRLDTAEADLSNGRLALDDQRDVVTGVITSIYQEGDPQLLTFSSLLDSETPSDLTLRMEMQNAMVGRESRAYDELRAAEVLLEVRQQQVEEARNEVAVRRREAARHLDTMQELEATAQDARDRVQVLVVDRRDARRSAASARAQDRAQLARLRAQERKIKERILEQARRARQGRGGYTGNPSGLLSRPVPGPVTSPFGYRIHPIYKYYGLHNGTDFYTACGQAMQAVATGRVIARYHSPVYGNRLFLGLGMINGKFITAVYNHASSYRYGVGATVSRGATIGYAGSTGWSTGCHLHFTILANGKPVPPFNYL